MSTCKHGVDHDFDCGECEDAYEASLKGFYKWPFPATPLSVPAKAPPVRFNPENHEDSPL